MLASPQRLQRPTPGDDLVEHGGDRLLVLGSQLEDAELLEICEEGEVGLVECDMTYETGNLVARATSTCMTLRGEQAPLKRRFWLCDFCSAGNLD
jgi:hypothetical protein